MTVGVIKQKEFPPLARRDRRLKMGGHAHLVKGVILICRSPLGKRRACSFYFESSPRGDRRKLPAHLNNSDSGRALHSVDTF